jgi:S1-C subfamily serine protease
VRPAPLAAVAIVAAVLGGAAVLLVGRAAGWGDPSGTRTVVIKETAPAAASPATVRTRGVKPQLGNGFDPAKIYALRSPGVVTIYAYFGSSGPTAASQGSGFVVSADGYILTNSHVITSAGDDAGATIEQADDVYVQFKDRDRVPAKIVGWDVFDDVGLIRVDPMAHPLQPLPLGDSAAVRVGEPVAAIGSPFGNENSLTVGVVSAVHRSIKSLTSSYNLVDAIQTDAPITHGNSGGPLFDGHGHVIGINAQIRSESGTAEGVGFAVPINSARRSMRQLIASGRVAYAYVGITTEDLTRSIARRFGYPESRGALISSVRPGTPGDRAGLRGGTREVDFNGSTLIVGGDVVVAIDRHPVRSAEDLVRVVTEELRPGEQAVFTVLRGEERVKVRVTVEERPSESVTGR